MSDFESRVRQGLQPVPGDGFTTVHREEVHRLIADAKVHADATVHADAKLKRSGQGVRRRLRMSFAGAAAVVLGLCAAGAVVTRSFLSTPVSHGEDTAMQIQALLTKHGWHEAKGPRSVWTTKLPTSFALKPTMPPLGLYWAYHNVLSRAVGLDMTKYLGETVKVRAIPLKENWKVGPSGEITYAIIVMANRNVIGAWASKGAELHIVDMCESLTRKEFGDLIKLGWGEWLIHQHLVNYQSGFYARMAKWTPRQLVQNYFAAVNSHHDNQAYAMMSPLSQYQMMTINVPVGHLYNAVWDPDGYGLANWSSAKLLSMKPYHYIDPKMAPGKTVTRDWMSKLFNDQHEASYRFYTITFDAKFKKMGPLSDGRGGFYTTIVKETANAPWTIRGFSTGP